MEQLHIVSCVTAVWMQLRKLVDLNRHKSAIHPTTPANRWLLNPARTGSVSQKLCFAPILALVKGIKRIYVFIHPTFNIYHFFSANIPLSKLNDPSLKWYLEKYGKYIPTDLEQYNPNEIASNRYALTSADVERICSQYKSILRDNRRRFTFPILIRNFVMDETWSLHTSTSFYIPI